MDRRGVCLFVYHPVRGPLSWPEWLENPERVEISVKAPSGFLAPQEPLREFCSIWPGRENQFDGRENQLVVQFVQGAVMVYFFVHADGETRKHPRAPGKPDAPGRSPAGRGSFGIVERYGDHVSLRTHRRIFGFSTDELHGSSPPRSSDRACGLRTAQRVILGSHKADGLGRQLLIGVRSPA